MSRNNDNLAEMSSVIEGRNDISHRQSGADDEYIVAPGDMFEGGFVPGIPNDQLARAGRNF